MGETLKPTLIPKADIKLAEITHTYHEAKRPEEKAQGFQNILQHASTLDGLEALLRVYGDPNKASSEPVTLQPGIPTTPVGK